MSRRYNWREARKATRNNKLPVPQTDTGRKEEDSKANGRRVVKELGKMSPSLREKGSCRDAVAEKRSRQLFSKNTGLC